MNRGVMPVFSGIPNGSSTCGCNGNEPGWRWQAGLVAGSVVLCLLFAGVAPVTTYVAALVKPLSSWSKPQSGWLYVLDPEVEDGKSVVWLVDPAEGVKGELKAGDAPFFALSPDGTRLYVSSGHPSPTGTSVFSDELWAIDTASGVLLQQVKLPDRLIYTLPAPGGLAVSPDGRYVYVAKTRTIRPGVHDQAIQAFDTIRNRFLPEEAWLSDCGFPQIIPVSGAWQLVVMCGSSGARLINLAADGSVKQSQFVEVPIGLSAVTSGHRVLQRPLAQVSPSAGARKLGLIMNNGEIFEAETGASPFRINRTLAPRLGHSHRVLHVGGSRRSRNDTKVFVSCASKELVHRSLTADEIHVFDTTSSWTREAIIQIAAPCSDLVLSADGRYLYGISPQRRSLLTINLSNGQVETSVGEIGVQPRFLAIAP